MWVRQLPSVLLAVGYVIAVAIGVAGCGSETPGSSPAHGHDGNPAPPTALPSGGAIATGCSDPTGDTAPGVAPNGPDLSDVALVSDGDRIVLAFTFTGPVLARGDLVLAVEASSQDGGTVRQLGVRLQDGQPQGAYIGRSSGEEPTQLDDAVHVAEDAVHAAFPLATIADLGAPWRWHAVIGSADGIGDLCPGGKDTTLSTIGSISVG